MSVQTLRLQLAHQASALPLHNRFSFISFTEIKFIAAVTSKEGKEVSRVS